MRNIYYWSAVIAALLICGYALFTPKYNWDMLPYAGIVYQMSGVENPHQKTFQGLKKGVPEKRYHKLINGNSYQREMSENRAGFEAQFPFYQIRFLYTGAIYLATVAGISPFSASHGVNAIAIFLGLLLLLKLLKNQLKQTYHYLIPLLIIGMIPLGLLKTARLSTPDGFAFLVIAAMIYGFILKRWWLLLILPVMVMVRTDLIMIAVMVQGYLLIKREGRMLLILTSGVATLGTYLFLNSYFGHFGWATLFTHAFINLLIYPGSEQYLIEKSTYLSVLQQQLSQLNRISVYGYFTIFLTMLLLYFRRNPVNFKTIFFPDRTLFLVISSLIYYMAHFLLFPMAHSRFFLGCGAMVLIALLFVMTQKKGQSLPIHQ